MPRGDERPCPPHHDTTTTRPTQPEPADERRGRVPNDRVAFRQRGDGDRPRPENRHPFALPQSSGPVRTARIALASAAWLWQDVPPDRDRPHLAPRQGGMTDDSSAPRRFLAPALRGLVAGLLLAAGLHAG